MPPNPRHQAAVEAACSLHRLHAGQTTQTFSAVRGLTSCPYGPGCLEPLRSFCQWLRAWSAHQERHRRSSPPTPINTLHPGLDAEGQIRLDIVVQIELAELLNFLRDAVEERGDLRQVGLGQRVPGKCGD